jgi:hypothetical protein
MEELQEQKALGHVPGKGNYKGIVNLSGGNIGSMAVEPMNPGELLFHHDIAERNVHVFGFDPLDYKHGKVFDALYISGTKKKPNPHRVATITKDGDNFGIEHHGAIDNSHIQKLAKHMMDSSPVLEPVLTVTNQQGDEDGVGSKTWTYNGHREITRFIKSGHPKSEAYLHIEMNRYQIAEEIKKVFLSKRDLTN